MKDKWKGIVGRFQNKKANLDKEIKSSKNSKQKISSKGKKANEPKEKVTIKERAKGLVNIVKENKMKTIVGTVTIVLFVVVALIAGQVVKEQNRINGMSAENRRAMNYEQVQEGDEIVENTNGAVNFDAFFLRDLNGDGYTESIRGTSKEIGKEDTLYMELNVQTEGYLKNAKIEINGENFYLQTALPKDDELKDNYIGNNIKTIEFNDLANGTQKMIMGIVRSGDYSYSSSKADAIGNNINNYSKVNSVTLTGTYVNGAGEEKEISKTVDFNIDWYGTTKASIYSTSQTKNIENAIDEENGVVNLDFTVYTEETNNALILSKNQVEGEIPELNGYAPTSVEYTGSNGVFNYDAETRKFTITRESVVSEDGTVTSEISSSCSYGIRVTYPIDAYYELGTETVTLKVPVKTYYEGYNNQNKEFTNPYKSNIASATIVANYQKPSGTVARFEVTVGKYISNPSYRYIVSKEKPLNIYNGISENETEDEYLVKWYGETGSTGTGNIIMKETKDGETQKTDEFIKTDSSTESMEEVTSFTGIYFSNPENILGEEGEIKVYDEDTGNLLVTFNKDNWNKYSSSNPYKYEIPVKHIRVETSEAKSNQSIYVYNIKTLDDEQITTKYTREQFDNLQYIKSTLAGYIGGTYINTDTHQANYEAPISVAGISISNNTLSTQSTEKNVKITIQTQTNASYNQVRWQNGTFLVKIPDEILTTEINEVRISNSNVQLTSYELIENENGTFIKINTQNDTPQTYTITIDADLSPDPRIATTTKQLELYATNEVGSDYYYKTSDIYDVNDNLNTEEMVNKTSTSISLVSPNSLLTNQTATNYDDKGSTVVSPEIADIKPVYAVVDQEQEEQTVDIGVQIKNNYASTISEIQILGKIPFEGNTYVLSGGDLGSTFTTKMTNTGIQVPAELAQIAKVYYSENETPDKDLSKEENGWKTADQVENWDNIKTFLIDLGDYVMPTGKEFVFNYTVKIPNGLEFNQVSYSHHGVYFCLDTDQGKYRTQTEPNRIGFRIAEKYNLELTKYQTGKDKLVPGATYSITEITTNEGGEETRGESKTAVTNAQGILTISNLYAEKEYEIQEIKTPDDYELNSEIIRFIAHVNEEGTLTIEKKQGTTKGDIQVEKQEGQDYKVKIQVEDEARAILKVVKKEQGTENLIQGARFKLTGYNLSENGRSLTTNANGEITFSGLSVNQEYALQEVKAEGYYLANPIKFKIVNNDGNYTVEKIEDENATGEIKEQTTTEEDSIPTISVTIEDEKIPTYDLQLIKIKKTTESTVSDDELIAEAETALANTEVEYLAGAKFKLYKGTEEIGAYTTDSTGTVTIPALYQYEEEKGIDQTYTLKEVLAPAGYAKVKDITFKVQEVDGALVLKEINEYGEETDSTRYTAEGNTIKLTIEDSPSFKLIKKDAETQTTIPNVKFAIYNVDNGEVPAVDSKGEIIGTKETINGEEYYTVSTDENGEITADLPEGLYKAVEVGAPEQYDISNSTYYFGIGASRETSTTMRVDFVRSVGESSNDVITSVASTSDGGYIAGGIFYSDEIQVGDYTLTNIGNRDGMIIKYSAEGEVEWARSVGGNSSDYINSVAETSDGGIVAGGYFQSSNIQVGDYTLTNDSYAYDGMIIKYRSNGKVEWAKSVGGYYSEVINSVASTSDGGIVAGGYFESNEVQVGDYTLNNNATNVGDSDEMIIKYRSNGEVEWARSVGGNHNDKITSVAETIDGGYIAVGYFESDEIQVGEDTLTNANSVSYSISCDGMIIKYDEHGTVKWARSVGGDNKDYIQSVVATSDGGIIAGGYFESNEIQVGDCTLTNSGNDDGMIIKYSSEGEVEWARSVGGDNEDYIRLVVATSDGGIIAGGYFRSSSIQVEDYTLTNNSNSGWSDGMIIKYNSEGVVEWGRSLGGVDHDYIYSVASTSDGGIVAGGGFKSAEIQVGDYTLTNSNSGAEEGMIVKFEEKELVNVDVAKAEGLGGNNYDYINSVAETSDGGYIAGGYFGSSIQVGDYTLTNSGSYDGIIIKYSREGIVEWAKSVGGNNDDSIEAVVETSDGGYIAGGYFASNEIQVGDYTFKNNSRDNGIIIKYSREGEVEWARNVGGSYDDDITSVAETSDGGYIVGGTLGSASIQVGDYTLNNSGDSDGMIIKYSREGEVELATSVRGGLYDCITSVASTSDGGYIAGGYFESKSIQMGDYTLTKDSYSFDGMIIKYSREGVVEWARSVGGSSYDYIYSVAETSDGGYIVGGRFQSSSIQVGDYTLPNNSSRDNSDGMIIKYSAEGTVEWARSVGGSSDERITSVVSTSDGGYIVGGYFSSDEIKVVDYTLTNNSSSTSYSDGMMIKYDIEGAVEWVRSVGGNNTDSIESVAITSDEGVIAGGYFRSDTIEVGRFNLENKGGYDGLLLKLQQNTGVPKVQELTVENTRKEFRITTDVIEIDNVKGGIISGEDKNPYETVKYGETSTKEIKMTPDENYEIIGITVNEEEYPFEEETDGTYTMPLFTNMTEDKHIEVTFALKDNKLTINKVNSKTKEPLEGATFKIDQIEERTEQENVIGEIVANGAEYEEADTTNEIADVQGELTNNGTYYFVQNEDGTLTPTNSKTYQQEINGENADGIQNSIANSYVPIDLSGKEGKYVVVVNAQVSSENNYDYGYATITNSTTVPPYSSSTGRFMYITGTSSSVTTAKDYTSTVLEGGQTYYLHLGYRKDSSGDAGEDQVTINSVKVYKAKNVTYNFIENEGKYESNNQGKDNTTANSYIPIDLTEYTGKYNLTVNAQISSESSDYGYATITNSTTAPVYSSSTGRFIYISGTDEEDTTPTDYTTVLQGGQMYYLHLGYYKNASTSSVEDKFTVNSIKITPNDSELYHTEVTTNSEGQGIVQIPFGKYQITEIKAPEGYELKEEPTIIEFRADGDNHEITIENNTIAKVIVHHYLKDNEGNYTTTKVAEDEVIEKTDKETYTTSPKLDLEKYELEKDEEGNYIIPEKATGNFISGETIKVTYYYEEKELPLTVHHYIEGTTEKVPLKDGTVAEDVKDSGKEGETYQTSEIEDSLLSDDYEIAEIPENASGTYEGEEIEVIYYYKKVERKIIINKYDEDGQTPLEGVTFEITAKENPDEVIGTYITNEKGQIEIQLEAGEYIAKETEVPENYQLPEENETEFTVTKQDETVNIDITNTKKKGTVITHYYIEGTEEKVPSNVEGQVVEDVTQTGNVGDIYATKQAENVAINYEFVSSTDNTSGEIVEGTTTVIYYYKLKDPTIETPEITKESSTQKVTDVNQAIDYTINYQTTIDQYIGNATVTIVDTLPYEIDLDKSNIANGSYNSEEKTITWTEEIDNIDTFANKAKEINITKEISLVYKDIDVTQANVENTVTGTILLETPEKEETVEDTKEIPTEYLVNISVQKVWSDNNNEAGKRPSQIDVVIKNGNEEVRRETFDNTKLQYTFTNLPKYDDLGNEITYTVSEEEKNADDLKFYVGEVSGNIETGYTITNTFTVPDERIEIPVMKVWNDNNNEAQKRPENVTFVLTGNGQNYELTLESSNIENGTTVEQWTGKFTNLPKYDANGDEITYTLSEKDTGNIFYTSENTIVEQDTKTVTNTFEVPDKKISIDITKNWEDTAEQKGKRPTQITVEVTGNGKTYTEVLDVTNAEQGNEDTWKATIADLPKYDRLGNEIEYTVKELETNKFYTTNMGELTNVEGQENKKQVTITNTFTRPQDVIEIPVTKVWNDNSNEAEKRPESITFVLTGNAQEYELTLESSKITNGSTVGQWTGTFTNLPKYDDNGDEIEYTLDEKDLNNEFYQKTDINQETKTITNTFEVPGEKITVVGRKQWDDNENIANKRPESVTLQIKNGDQLVQSQVVNEGNNWTYEFSVPKYDSLGNPITYTVDEAEFENKFYTKTGVTGNMTEGYTVTNKFQVPDEKIEIPVTKVWEDNNNKAGKRPETVTFVLEGNGQTYKVTLDGTNTEEGTIIGNENVWTDKFKDLPKYDANGDEIVYILSEENTGSIFYTSENTVIDQETRTIINTFEVPDERIEIPVTKVWNDNSNEAQKRPESVTFVLTGNGQKYELTLESSKIADGSTVEQWTGKFTNLPKYDENGDEIEYTLSEKDTGNIFYTSENTTIDQDTKTVTNTFEVPNDTIELTVNKEWDDNDTQAQRRPETIVINVKAENADNNNPETVIDTYELNTQTETSHTFTGLPKYNRLGNEIRYTVEEQEKNEGDLHFYTPAVSEVTNVEGETDKKQATITNTFTKPQDETQITVNKIWNDNETQAERRPESIIIVIKNGEQEVKTQEITKANIVEGTTNQWSTVIEGLQKYDENGNEIQYTVEEREKTEGDLKFYEVEENNVAVQDKQATIRNNFKTPDDVINVTVRKIWNDNNDANGKRPESIKIQLLANGEFSKEQTIDEEISENDAPNIWEYTFVDLAKYDENGQEIQYTVQEQEVNKDDLKFYETTEPTGDMVNGYEITNTFTVPNDTIEIKVNKEWRDNEIQAQRRPGTIVINVKAENADNNDPEAVIDTYELNTKTETSYTFTGLQKYNSQGNEIEYKVEEKEKNPDDLKFYKATIGSISDVEENKKEVTIINTFERPEDLTEITVTKVWNDNNDEAQKRPESIILKLKNGNTEVKEQEVNVSNVDVVTGEQEEAIIEQINNNVTGSGTELLKAEEVEVWQYTFIEVDKYDDNGQEIVYTADETEVNSNDLQFYTKEQRGTTVINTFTQDTTKVNVPVTKIWEDNEIQAQKRPESVIIVLKANGAEAQRYELSETSAETVNENTWTYTFKDLPKYDEYNNIINYTVEEKEKNPGDLKFYTSKVEGTTITNTFTRPTDTISIEVSKKWEDQEDKYKKRPVSIRLQVKTTGENGTEPNSNNVQANVAEGVNVNSSLQTGITKQTNTNENSTTNTNEIVVQSAVVTKEQNWTYTFTKLDKYDENGQEIVYTVDEEEVMENDLYYYGKEVGEVTDKAGETDVKEAEITNTMNKTPSTVVVKYVDKNTGEEISDEKVKEGIIGDPYDVTEDVKEIPGYTLVEEPEEKTGVYTSEPQEKIYYYVKNTKVIVKYLEQDETPNDIADNKVLAQEKTMLGYEGESYSTFEEKIPNYTLVETTDNTSGVMQREEIVVIYYYAPNTNVVIKYLEKDNTPEDNTDNKVLEPERTIEGYVGKEYKTIEEDIQGYTLVETTENTEGTMTKEPIEVIYYYAQNTKVIVKYLEKDDTPEDNTDNQVLAKEEVIEGYEGKEYETEQKTIDNYTFVESTNNTKGNMTKEIIEVIYYYAQNTKAKVQHIDRETGEILKEETKNGKVGDIFETQAEDFEGYVLVESPEEPNIIMDKTGEQVVKYYYAHVSGGVIEKHIDEITGELLYSEEHKGNEGDYYNIPSKTFEGYDLVTEDSEGNSKLPTNAEGNMTQNLIEVKYYYIKKAKVIVKYLEQDNTPEDLTDNLVLEDEETIEGHENDDYTTTAKEIKGYNLVETPENATGKMEITKNPDGTYNTEIIVVYYYKKQSGGVIENHIDIHTNKKLAVEEHEGNVGDEYDIPARDFEGYDLVTEDEEGNNMLPTNAKGQMTEEVIEVNYYYEKQAKVKVEYIDKQTGNKLDEDEIQGHVGDSYETEEKQFEGYDLVEKPSNSKGEMEEEEIVVKYYYERKAEVEVKYLEKGTDYEVSPTETIEGHVGDKYETEEKEIPYYKFVEKTENYKGEMEKDKITVIYYYEKQLFNLSVDKWVENVNVNGISQGAQSITTKDQLYKVDIHRSKTETADIKITYKIRITNKGEIEGTAGEIVEVIPAGYSFNQEDNSIYWENKNGTLTTDALKDEMIQPGQYKEIEIVLRWIKGEDNFGQKDNLVILSNLNNPAGYEDVNKEDNSSSSSMLLTIATGLDRNDRIVIIGIVQIVLAISIGLLLSYKKKEKTEKNSK